MTTKRSRGIEAMRANAVNRLSKGDYSRALYSFHNINGHSSKPVALKRSKTESGRDNSPTCEDLLVTRVKLIKDSTSISRGTSANRRTIDSKCKMTNSENHERQSSTVLQSEPLPSTKQIKSQSNLINRPFDEITHKQPWSYNDNMQQKRSLEIWLPKAAIDDDDDDENTSQSSILEVDIIEKNSELTPTIQRCRSSSVKTIASIETKSFDEFSSKSSESLVIPPVDQYEEQTYSSESLMTVDSDGSNLDRSTQCLHTTRQSIPSNESKELLSFKTIELPTSVNNLPINTNSVNSKCETNSARKSTNPSMVSKFIQKYALMKKNHQIITQAKRQLENVNNDLHNNINLTNDRSSRVRLPLRLGSTTLTSSDYPTVSVKNLVLNKSANDRIDTNTKLYEHCLTSRKPSHSDIYPQLRTFCLANQQQQRQSSGSVLPATLLPTILEKKTDDSFRTLQRSKTLNIVLNVSNPIKLKSYVSAQPNNSLFQCSPNGTLEEAPYLITKRSAFTPRSNQQQGKTSVLRNSIKHFHHSSTRTTVANK